MIVLDTNVLSELIKAEPDGRVMAWMSRQSSNNLALTAVTVGEILSAAGGSPTRTTCAGSAVRDQ